MDFQGHEFVVIVWIDENHPDYVNLDNKELVPTSWIQEDESDGFVCAFPPPPHDNVDELIEKSHPASSSWQKCPVHILGYAGMYLTFS